MSGLGLNQHAIAIEITEGLLLESSDKVKNCLMQYREAGLQVALDDFGMGYSSLAYLNRFDIDYLKIDKAFVQDLAPGSEKSILCEAIIMMAHKLGLKVVAEGVETPLQHDLLVSAGCDYAQGFLLLLFFAGSRTRAAALRTAERRAQKGAYLRFLIFLGWIGLFFLYEFISPD